MDLDIKLMGEDPSAMRTWLRIGPISKRRMKLKASSSCQSDIKTNRGLYFGDMLDGSPHGIGRTINKTSQVSFN